MSLSLEKNWWRGAKNAGRNSLGEEKQANWPVVTPANLHTQLRVGLLGFLRIDTDRWAHRAGDRNTLDVLSFRR